MLVSIMLVTTLVLFVQLLASTTKTGYLDTATLYADQIMEQAIANPRPTSPAYFPIVIGEKAIQVQGDLNPTKFLYELEATKLDDGTTIGERWLLSVEVRWWTDDVNAEETARSGYGELRTSQSRVVYTKW